MTLYAADNLHHSYNADNNINCPPLSVYMYMNMYKSRDIKMLITFGLVILLLRRYLSWDLISREALGIKSRSIIV